MPDEAPLGTPRHMAGSKRTTRRRAVPVATPAELTPLPETADDAPVARVHRSRLAFAVSVTLAALPILVLDNFPATADTGPPAEARAASTVEHLSAASTAAPMGPSTTIAVALPAEASGEAAASSAPADGPSIHALAAAQSAAAPQKAAAPTTTTPPAPPVTAARRHGDPADPATWDELARCESAGNWSSNSGNGYYGGLQFSLTTWREVGGTGYPHQNSRAEQIKRGQILQAEYGWGQWPVCSRRLGFR